MKSKTIRTEQTATVRSKPAIFLVGYGLDIHNISKTKKGLVLGGVLFPKEPALVAHSDGDVILHAVANGILGALGLGDIGIYFADTDNNNKGIDSKRILALALKKMRGANYELGNADIQLVAEKIMIGPKRKQLLRSLKVLLLCDRVNVKGTRWEKANKQVASHVVLTLVKN